MKLTSILATGGAMALALAFTHTSSGPPKAASLATRPVGYQSPIPNPTNNIPAPASTKDACSSAQSASCYNAIVSSMNLNTVSEGGKYMTLPPGFMQMNEAEQLFVLTNLERLAFGLHPIYGLTANSNSIALAAAKAQTDPSRAMTNYVYAFDGNWAYNYSPVIGFYDWMFNDGMGSDNEECYAGYTGGCWGHRDNILAAMSSIYPAGWGGPASWITTMGAAVVPEPQGMASSAMIISWVSNQNGNPPAVVTWNQIASSYPSGESPVSNAPSSSPGTPSKYPAGSLWRKNGTSPVYVVTSSSTLFHIPSPLAFKELGLNWGNINVVDNLPSLSLSSSMAIPTGTFWRQAGTPSVYIVTPAGTLYHIPSPAVFYAFHGNWNQVKIVPELPSLQISGSFSY